MRDRARGVPAQEVRQPVCMDCKREGWACVLVTRGQPCLGPVTNAGCGALCPAQGRPCYGCYGPAELPNLEGLKQRFAASKIETELIERRLAMLHTDAQGHAVTRRGCKSVPQAVEELEVGDGTRN